MSGLQKRNLMIRLKHKLTEGLAMSVVRVNKLRVGSFAKVVAIAQATIAFIYGLIFTLAVIGGELDKSSSLVRNLGVSIGVLGLSVIIFPVVAYILGWIQGAVAGIILNFVFKESGGLELETEDVK
jgi:hypothetical protein